MGGGGEQKESASTPMAYTDGSSDDDDEEDVDDVEMDDGTLSDADEEMNTTGTVAMNTIGRAPPGFYRPGGQEPGSTRGNSSKCETKSSIPSSSSGNVHHKRSFVPPTIIPPLSTSFIATPMSTKISSPHSTRPPLDILQTTNPIVPLLNQQQHPSLAIETETISNQQGIASTQTTRQEGGNIKHSKHGGFGRPKIGQQQQQQERDRQGRNKFQDFFHNMCKQS